MVTFMSFEFEIAIVILFETKADQRRINVDVTVYQNMGIVYG